MNQQSSDRIVYCRREDLSYECRATLFDQEVNMSENIDFQFPMKKACNAAITSFCKDLPHGHARVIRCLQENVENSAMPKECKDQVQEYTTKAASDYRHLSSPYQSIRCLVSSILITRSCMFHP